MPDRRRVWPQDGETDPSSSGDPFSVIRWRDLCDDPDTHTNLYSNSTLVLDPDSGAIQFYFQYTPCDPYDYDGVNEVILADVAGKKVWLHGDRNGFLYSIDRSNGNCNWAVAMSRINWTTGFKGNCVPIFNWPEMDVFYDKVTLDIAPMENMSKPLEPLVTRARTLASNQTKGQEKWQDVAVMRPNSTECRQITNGGFGWS